ncbi:YihY/virulence factor BrkB family protein [Schumannella sp. 10F1B-5-1]|uniref:YihY/virulence factor BrkB family protein n=1 Tax=Schumannella sp. 10F1B-5-1 TaxID=2590780 RepID=UPI001130A855|nr:YihY/virulence factor BrkB family protein [Schumannella sp. 10F1B-5-1]TPW73510.1 YihY/virulence factor BrkB family protein [Schumannella sp. 10F1B-5-1]
MDGVKRLIAWVQRTRAVRVFQRYSGQRGPILASGLAYQALFAIFAAIWAGFSIAGLVISGDQVLREQLISTIGGAVPGLIKTGPDSAGAIDPDVLLAAPAFSLTLVISLVGLLVTALGFLASLRDGIRVIFELPALTGNPVLLKVKDLVVGLGFAVVLVASAALSYFGTTATDTVLGWLGIGTDSVIGFVLTRVVTIGVMFALDAVTLVALYRVLSGVPIPFERLRGGAIIGAVALGVLKVLFSAAIIGGVGSNPLLKSFAVILGLLIFFNFVCQVILIGAAWVVVGLDDRGLVVDPVFLQKRILDARVLLADHGYASGRVLERRRGRLRIARD